MRDLTKIPELTKIRYKKLYYPKYCEVKNQYPDWKQGTIYDYLEENYGIGRDAVRDSIKIKKNE